MAIKVWQGDATPVAQQDRITITVANSFAYTVTIGGSTLTYTSTATATKLDIANGLISAINSSGVPGQFRRVQAQRAEPTTGNYTVDVYPRTAGEPFTLTVGSNLSRSTLVSSAGPNHGAGTANWGGALPQDGDTLVFKDTSASLLWDLAQFAAMTFAAVYVYKSFRGRIGLSDFNFAAQDSPFAEYRGTKLECGITLLEIGIGPGDGSPLLRFDLKTIQAAIVVHSTGTPDGDYGAVQIVNAGASSTARITAGSVDIAYQQGEAATVASIDTSYEESPDSDVTLRIGSGATVTNLRSQGGKLTVRCATTLVEVAAGSLRVESGDHTSIALTGTASLDYRSTGTLGTLTAGAGNTTDFSANPAGCTVSNCTLQAGASIVDPAGGVVWTNGIILDGCGVEDVALNVGVDRTIDIS